MVDVQPDKETAALLDAHRRDCGTTSFTVIEIQKSIGYMPNRAKYQCDKCRRVILGSDRTADL